MLCLSLCLQLPLPMKLQLPHPMHHRCLLPHDAPHPPWPASLHTTIFQDTDVPEEVEKLVTKMDRLWGKVGLCS